MTPDPAIPSNEAEYDRLLRQRDQALVCAILAAAIACAVVWSNFGREYPGLKEMEEAVRQHLELQLEHEKIKAAVNSALMENRRELEKIQQAGRGSP